MDKRLLEFDPEFSRRRSAAYDRWRDRVHIAAALSPALPFYFIWWDMVHLLGYEGAVGVISVAQIFTVIWANDWITWRLASWLARREMTKDRKTEKDS